MKIKITNQSIKMKSDGLMPQIIKLNGNETLKRGSDAGGGTMGS
jgi:hypothetical protein